MPFIGFCNKTGCGLLQGGKGLHGSQQSTPLQQRPAVNSKCWSNSCISCLHRPRPASPAMGRLHVNHCNLKTVLDMPGAAVKEPNSDGSLCSIWDDFSSAVNYTTSTPALKLHALLAKCAESITGWKQRVLATRDGSGCLLSSQEVPEFKDGLPVRITVNGCFEADCLDSNDLVKLFCCCPKDNALLQQGSDISIAR